MTPPTSTTAEPRRPRRARPGPAARSSTRATCGPRIVHFGLGAFHRAHQAVYTEAAAARTGEPWGIVAVAPRSADDGRRDARAGLPVLGHRPGARRRRRPGWSAPWSRRCGMRPDAARLDRAAAPRPRSRVVTLTVTEKGYSRRPDTAAWTPRRPGSPPTCAATAATDAGPGHGRRPARPRRSPPGSGPAAPRSTSSPATTSPPTAPHWPAWCGSSSRRRPGPTGTRSSTGWRPRSASRTRSSTASSRPPPPRTATPPPRRSACATRWPVVGEPYRQWVLQDAFVAARPRVGARRRAGRPGRRAVPADEAAPAQRVALGDGLPRRGRGLHDGRRGAGDRVGRAAGARLRCGGRADPADRPGRTRRDVRRRPGRPVPQPRHAPPAAPDRLGRIAEDPRAVVPRAAGRCARRRQPHAGARAGPGRLGQRHPAGRDGGQVYGTTDPAADALARCWTTRRTRRRWSRHCCAPSAPPTWPSRPTSPRPSPRGFRRCAPDGSNCEPGIA